MMCPVSSLPPTKVFAKIWVSQFLPPKTERWTSWPGKFCQPDNSQNPRIHVKALVILDYSYEPSHYSCVRTLGDWLSSQGIPGIYGVDTRAITKIIRQHLAFWEKTGAAGRLDEGGEGLLQVPWIFLELIVDRIVFNSFKQQFVEICNFI